MGRGRLIGWGQVDEEARAASELALNGDRAAMLHHNLVYDCQAQAGTLVLGGEEWVEDVIELVLPYSRAGVAYLELSGHKAATCQYSSCYRYDPARLCSLNRIEDQINQHLLDLVAIGPDEWWIV